MRCIVSARRPARIAIMRLGAAVVLAYVWLGGFWAASLFGIGLGYPGQPHVVNRFMAIRDQAAIVSGRRVAIAWAAVLYAGMVLLVWCGRVLVSDFNDGEQMFFHLSALLLPAVFAGVMVSAILSAIMSTADSQLLVAAAFSPLLVVTLWRGTVAPRWRVAALGPAKNSLAFCGNSVIVHYNTELVTDKPRETQPC